VRLGIDRVRLARDGRLLGVLPHELLERAAATTVGEQRVELRGVLPLPAGPFLGRIEEPRQWRMSLRSVLVSVRTAGAVTGVQRAVSDPHPDRIEGYRIESELARGGMGIVYLARQTFPDRRVALKLLSPELAADPDFRERFIRESNAAASTEHPNIVPIYGAGEADGRLYLAMRYVQGTDLGALIRGDGPLDPERAVAICSQVAAALDAAHARGLVHRDVKPGNVLIDEAGNAYLTDFGLIARNEVETGITKTGQFMGTTAYCAPEQIRGDEVDARTDVYSLGCVLFECLTGQPPFPRENEAATLYAHLQDTPTKPSARRASVPSSLDVVVRKAMAKRPDWRYRGAGEMASEARAAIGHPDVGHAPAARSRRVLAWGIGVAVVSLGLIIPLALSMTDDQTKSTTPNDALALQHGLLAIDPLDGHIAKKLPGQIGIGGFGLPPSLVAGEGALWTTALSGPIRVDPSNGDVRELFNQCNGASLGVSLGTVWVVCGTDIHAVDPFTLDVRDVRWDGPAGGGFATALEEDRGTLWACFDSGSLARIDTLDEQATLVPDVQADLCSVGEGALWVVDRLRSTVTPVDLETGRTGTPIIIAGDIDAIDAGAGGVWLLDSGAGTVTRIDPQDHNVGGSIGIGEGATSITAAFGSTWITVPSARDLVRIDPLTRDVQRVDVNAAAIFAAPDRQTGWLWLVVRPPEDAG